MTGLIFLCLMLIVSVYGGDWNVKSMSNDQICDVKDADYVFILDSSGGPEVHHLQLEFVMDFSNELDHGRPFFRRFSSRVGVLSFSDKVQIQFFLQQFKNKRKMSRAISSIEYLNRRSSNTADAIEMARNLMFTEGCNARSDLDHIAIVITDGISGDPQATLREAELAREKGIKIIAIGFGNKISENELVGIASSPAPRFVYYLGNPHDRVVHAILSSLATCSRMHPKAYMYKLRMNRLSSVSVG